MTSECDSEQPPLAKDNPVCRLADMDQFAFQCILADREIPVHYGIEEFREDLLTIDALARR